MKLYELTDAYNDVLDLLDNEEATMEDLADTLDSINEAIAVKIDNICRLRKYLDGKTDVYKAEAKRLTTLAKQAENNSDRLKNYVDEQLKKMDIKRLDTELFRLSYRKSEKTIVDDVNKLPDELKKVEYKPMAAEIKKYIKEHGSVDGARIEVCMNLQIK